MGCTQLNQIKGIQHQIHWAKFKPMLVKSGTIQDGSFKLQVSRLCLLNNQRPNFKQDQE